MAKVNQIGKQYFTQYLKYYPANWGYKLGVSGWSQEIDEPFRTGVTFILRLPFHRAFVLGKWVGELPEETALNKAIQGRVLKDEDFEEGWTPPAYQVGTKSIEDWDI